mgnify:CR=1 FL=1
MNITIFNWRDIKNPAAGGAEVLIHNMAREWVSAGHRVSLVTAGFSGGVPEETIDGVTIFRTGNAWTVYWAAFQLYRSRLKGNTDLVIDEINTIPFFTPLYVKEPIVMHFNQLARQVWFYECPWPFNLIGFLMESWWLKLYKKCFCVAISRSSRNDLLRLGIPQSQVTVVPMPTKPYLAKPSTERSDVPTFLYVGRIKRSKRVADAIEAFGRFSKDTPDAALKIIGTGDQKYLASLHQQVEELGLGNRVTFLGQVSEAEKYRQMRESHAILVPSVREGWGLIVTEAYSQGTPAIVYPVAGLVDSTQHGLTGLVCRQATPNAMSERMKELMENQGLQARLMDPNVGSQEEVTWQDTAGSYLKALERYVGTKPYQEAFSLLSIVIPVFESKGGAQAVVQNVSDLVSRWGELVEVILIEDQPNHQVKDLLLAQGVQEAQLKIVRRDSNVAHSEALGAGWRFSSGDLVLYVEPQLSMKKGELTQLIESWQRRPADVVVASRKPSGKLRPWTAQVLSSIYYQLTQALFGVDFGNAQVGVKLFRKRLLDDVYPRLAIKEYAVDVELLAVAHERGFSIGIEPIKVFPQSSERRAHWLDIFHLLVDTLSIWHRLYKQRYYDRPLCGPRGTPLVSIVIPCKAPSPFLAECLAACRQMDYPKEKIEIFVLPDESIEQAPADVTVIPTGPVGPGKKRDRALSSCQGEIVAFLDDDAIPRFDWLRNAVRIFEDERIGAVGGPAPTPASDSIRQVASGQVFSSWMVGGNQGHRYLASKGRWIDDYPSCNLFVRKEVLLKAGGFDTPYWPGEDTVLCSRITHDLGLKMWYDPDVVVYHHRRTLFEKHLLQIRRYAEHRGYFVKRFPSTSLRWHYFLPSFLVAFFIVGALGAIAWPAWRWLYGAAVLAYLLAAMLSGMLSLNLPRAILVFSGIVLTHWTYGIFFVKGLLTKSLREEVSAG